MKKTLLSIAAGGLLSLVVSSPASASLKLIVDDATVAAPTGTDATRFVDVYFQETAPLQDEKMTTLFLTAYLRGAGTGASGVHFGAFDAPTNTPAGNPHTFVFPGQSVYNGGSGPLDFNVGADSAAGTTVNVLDGMGVVRLPLIIPVGATPGNYAIRIDDGGPGEIGNTSFGSADEATFPGTIIPFTTQDGTLTVTAAPEPAALGLFAVAGIGTLLRRRRK